MTSNVIGVLLEDKALSLEELARACAVEPDWVVQRVQTGVLLHDGLPPGQLTAWRFTSLDLVRARRLREIESVFDANADLAALVVDLSEEVARLRRRLHVLGAD
ncbi:MULTISPECIES: MerR family transcriptional regulator [unclassified Janthinobacterium]|uniref:MerR family transcriptional regulator n=1 Tax=unclassified Janthinobacterium TaxID=2610881 RepID=UPI001609D031|nr:MULTISPECIES: MerR family transcriptional regulator [unclassified Janthinobacterium]MBB5369590.1 chaperone modulatory protein CbpM [Janthinobacterium sp. K2C7]MBB5382454.1 chaperone modulatory protein CbpM [Janthinobacterium sp. K2Li3]MBB5388031.1 chaperone modulatory protein CbpM [Janthinobacterium sp. K2E3]